MPNHIGIIMDGNGRWAQNRGLPRTAGHQAGSDTLRKIIRACEDRELYAVTFYAFSTENWKRSEEEVGSLMRILENAILEFISDFGDDDAQLRFIGDREGLSPKMQRLMHEAEESHRHKTGTIINIALNYGGQQEIAHAVRAIAGEAAAGRLDPAQIDVELMNRYLYTAEVPAADLILRPSGEYRLSNFLLWQSAYAEFIFMNDVLWPDFTEEHLDRALEEFARRNRRFGGA